MAKKETIPTIIDTPEALTAKMAAMKEAQEGKLEGPIDTSSVESMLKSMGL